MFLSTQDLFFFSSVSGPLVFFECVLSLLFNFPLSLLTYFWLLLLVHICIEHLRQTLSSRLQVCLFGVFFSYLLTYPSQCWVHTTVGVQYMTAMNIYSCWSRTEVLVTTEPSHPCRSTTSTTTQVKVCLNDNIILSLCLEQWFVKEVVGLWFYSFCVGGESFFEHSCNIVSLHPFSFFQK